MTHISTKPEPTSQLEKCPSWVKSTKSTSEGSLWGTDRFEASEVFEQHVECYTTDRPHLISTITSPTASCSSLK